MNQDETDIQQEIQKQEHLDDIFSALANPIRRAIIEIVSSQEKSVNSIVNDVKKRLYYIYQEPIDAEIKRKPKKSKEASPTRAAISLNMKILMNVGLIEQTKNGRVRMCNLNPKPLSDAFSWVTRHNIFWDKLLDQIEEKALKNDIISEENKNE